MNKQKLRIYTWEFPVRLTHWVNVLCILTLSVTGFFIGHPFIQSEPAVQFVMGTIRFIHFTTAYLFLMSLIIRLYWAFVGNPYARWRAFLPFSSKRGRQEIIDNVKYYLFIGRKLPTALGHPALAGLTYLVFFMLFAFELFSGFALYAPAHEGGAIWTLLGGWLLGVMHLQTIRLYHHLAMYAILCLMIIHVYFAWYLDGVEESGLMSSMFRGYKFISGREGQH